MTTCAIPKPAAAARTLRALKLTVTAWRDYRRGLAALESALQGRPKDLQFFIQALAELNERPCGAHVRILQDALPRRSRSR